jgi:long-chain acyl-CoA synthetase
VTITAEAPSVTAAVTPASRVRALARKHPRNIALRVKNRGIWREINWEEYWDQVETFGHALLAAGIEVGDRVAIHAENRPEWFYTDLGTISVRGVCMGLYPTNPTAEVRYLLQNSGSRLLVVEDQEQADKVLEVPAADLPMLERIVYVEQRGVDRYTDPRLVPWDKFMEEGRAHRAAHPGEVERRMAAAEPTDLAYLIYTSGTTGPPKGAMLTVGNVDFAGQVVADGGMIDPPSGPDDFVISYLPLCHVYEKLLGLWLPLYTGAVVSFGESLDTLMTDIRDVQPTVFQAVPRIWERIHAGIQVKLASASRLKKVTAGIWLRVARYIGRTLVRTGGKHTPLSKVAYFFGNLFLYRSLKERVGLRRLRFGVSAAAPIAPEILEYFMSIGVPVYEGYGMTENSAIATCNRPGRIRIGTVGEPQIRVEVKIDEETGEILTRHPGSFVGYWQMPEATARTLDPDGWLHTGDVGEWVDGTHIRIVDRIKDIIITSGGKNISPSEIENSLKTSPFIKEAIVIGDRRKYLTALIGIEFDVVSEWAQRHKIGHTTYRDLSEKPEVIKLIQKAVDEANAKFSSVEGIKRFKLLPQVLDHETGELTATQKVKRSEIERKFGPLIEAMYQ